MDKNVIRKPFQGVFNIVRFNWHFYLLAFLFFTFAFILANYTVVHVRIVFKIALVLISYSVLVSLLVSYYIYDFKDFYAIKWLAFANLRQPKNIININAGFDETSATINKLFPNGNLKVLDFYDANINTEISIERARKVYPAYKNTEKANFNKLPIQNEFSELIFLIFAAHEIRKDSDRIVFFNELNRILDKNGKIIVVEHLRDFPNFLAFTIGFLHFYSKKTWQKNILKANLEIVQEFKLTLFTSLFIIKKNGNPS